MTDEVQIMLYLCAIIALFSFAVLCWYLIFRLGSIVKDLTAGLKNTEAVLSAAFDQIKDLKHRSAPILANLEETSKHSISISAKIDKQLDHTDTVVSEVAGITTRVAAIERDLENRIIEPIKQIGAVVSGTSKAVQVFASVLTDNSKNGKAGRDG